ncbi:MAG: D-alanyl-D-alanine carboxypeptidase/D-alanyl-D-alanine-endopeptidase, partial [Saprospiraceae bacterium]|nr:D-alanyl-D-alanine carboxypeptidase/D-alanyl-D-alanine-endopeptidase [Saprospiraceae bacterium]
LPPASTQKTLTTAAALMVLGRDFHYQTIIGTDGILHGDTLDGDLIIHGEGDPTLGSSHFSDDGFADVLHSILNLLQGAGVKHITGDIIGDASFYDKSTIPRSWPFLHIGNYYGAFCAGLNFNDNQHFLRFKQSATPGALIKEFKIDPEVPQLNIESLVTSGEFGSGDEAYIMGAPFQYNRYVQGTIPPGKALFTIKGSLPDPALFMAYHLKTFLVSHGITIKGQYASLYGQPRELVRVFGTTESPELQEIVDVTNQKSVNLFAEGLGLRSARQLDLDTDDWLLEFWKQKQIDMSGCHFYDYAGLAPDNALTAQSVVQILSLIYQQKDLWPVFLGSLSVAGEVGTLASMFKHSPAKGRIRAKSGLINGVRSYAGYMQSRSGRWYAFDIMTHNPDCGGIRNKLEVWLDDLYLSLP